MAEKKKKISKAKGVVKLIKSILKRKPAAAKKTPKKTAAKKTVSVPKPASPKTEQKQRLTPRVAEPASKKASTARASAPGARNGTPRLAEPAAQKVSTARPAATSTKNGRKVAADRPQFISTKSPEAGPRYFFHADIPDSYNDTYMRAMPRDPEWLFAYWELTESFLNSLKSKMGNAAFEKAKKILRLCDVTDIDYNGSNAQRYTDIEINDYANNWYVRVPEQGRAYVIECGFLTLDGKFYLAVRSNVITIPRFGLSPIQDEEWTTASTDELIRMSADGLNRPLGASEKRFGAAAKQPENMENMFGRAAGSGSGMFGMPSSRM